MCIRHQQEDGGIPFPNVPHPFQYGLRFPVKPGRLGGLCFCRFLQIEQFCQRTPAGIRPDGENRFVIAPVPGGSLTFAEASWKSLYGEVKSRWEKTADGYRYHISVPANTTAKVVLPDGRTEHVKAGEYDYV